MAMLEVGACCFLLCTAQANYQPLFVSLLLWNSKWEELQGHMDCPSSRLDEFLIGNQSLPATDNLSVTQRNHYVNYIFKRHFSALLIHCVMAATYCVN